MWRINKEVVLSYFLAFVVIWFGVSEVSSPERWVVFVPTFLNLGDMVNSLVMVHGVVLVLCGLSLVFNFYRRIAAFIVLIMLIDIVTTLILVSGLDEISVRDIGLLGMALALALKN
ncbi:hypothetical protein K8Q98_02420 [Candidatus Nomurabacteria bacterium]|nr:hypothetical protein [Candidatus Nomurabacteria bacterium]